ncbi:MAG: N-6 DNA methylase [Desulfovibrio sp.]|uniref:N-6 DNA methylase n=1 Tax=Desulfovibrio sp. TaxID=885 RepID=UPI0039E6B1CB
MREKFLSHYGVTRERAQSFLAHKHIQRVVSAYKTFADEDVFARVAGNDEIVEKGANLSMPLYIRAENGNGGSDGDESVASHRQLRTGKKAQRHCESQ